MDNWSRPTLEDFFKKEDVVVIKREKRRMYKINWKIFFRNIIKLFAFWKPGFKRLLNNTIVKNQTEDEIAIFTKHNIELLTKDNIESGLDGRNNMPE